MRLERLNGGTAPGGFQLFYYNLGHEGENWQQVIVDAHPNHQRSASGNLEHAMIKEPFPSTDPGKTYFDTMTYFYFHHKHSPTTFPAVFYFDGVEFYHDPNDEDVEQIYSLHGVYNTETAETVVGWKRNKNTSTKSFDVRYAETSFHTADTFINHGSPAPGGTGILPYSSTAPNGYNGIEYRGLIDVTGKDFIYVAIKHEDSVSRFREIKIPVTSYGYPKIGTGTD